MGRSLRVGPADLQKTPGKRKDSRQPNRDRGVCPVRGGLFAMFLRALTSVGLLALVLNACGPLIPLEPSSHYEVVTETAE